MTPWMMWASFLKAAAVLCAEQCVSFTKTTLLEGLTWLSIVWEKDSWDQKETLLQKCPSKRPTGWLRHQDEKEKWQQMTSILAEWQMRKKAGLRISIYYYSRKQRIQEFPSVISQTMKKVPILTTHSLTNGPQHDSSNGHSKLRELPRIQYHSLVT